MSTESKVRMFVSRRRHLRLLGGATATLAAVISLVVLVNGALAQPETLARYVPQPLVSAGPRQVVQVYLDAFEARDFSTAEALIEPAAQQAFQAWFAETPQISNIKVGKVYRDPSSGSRVEVAVTFNIQGADESMPDGATTWGYILDRRGRSQRWMIYDQGTG